MALASDKIADISAYFCAPLTGPAADWLHPIRVLTPGPTGADPTKLIEDLAKR